MPIVILAGFYPIRQTKCSKPAAIVSSMMPMVFTLITLQFKWFVIYFVFTTEFDPEPSPKWKALLEILSVEVPADIKRSVEYHSNALNNPIKVLVLCQDSRTCYQLNQYLTQGFERFLLWTAMKNDLPIPKISERFTKIREEAVAGGVVLIRAVDNYTAVYSFADYQLVLS